MSIRGERFVVDISDDEDEGHDAGAARDQHGSASAAFSFVGDIVEREPAAAKPPSAPTMKSTTTGFPEHKKRTRISAFKQQRNPDAGLATKTAAPATAAPSVHTSSQTNPRSLTPQASSFEDVERIKIDEENKQRLADMTEEEIKQEREELLASLSPAMIQSLLQRANLDEGRGDTVFEDSDKKDDEQPEISTVDAKEQEPFVIPQPSGKRFTAAKTVTFDDDDREPADPGELRPVTDFDKVAALPGPAVHFPSAPSAPELDPSDPSFLENLHTKYFPSLPADPSKLAWMAPIPTHGSIADQESPYYPGQDALPASALRFDFRGGLLPPRISRAVPTNKGLHHHGEAPESAGYTIPELARLARSAFPAQRCVAFQTLGRFLYRLGRGDLGDDGSEMVMGLWRCVDEGKVVETLEEAASAEGGHQGSKTYAVEALWLWQKGGGKKWKAS